MSAPTKKFKKDLEFDANNIKDEKIETEPEPESEVEALIMPPKEVLFKLFDRIAIQIPNDDNVKYKARAKMIDWETVKFDELSADECRDYWFNIQKKIRRFRILSELIPEARTWVTSRTCQEGPNPNGPPDEYINQSMSEYCEMYKQWNEDTSKLLQPQGHHANLIPGIRTMPFANEKVLLKNSILQREPKEPPRNPRRLFVDRYVSKHPEATAEDAKAIWRAKEKDRKNKYAKKLARLNDEYTAAHTRFVEGLNEIESQIYAEVVEQRKLEQNTDT